MSAAWYAKLAIAKRVRPRNASGLPPSGTNAIAAVETTHRPVKKSRNGRRRPPRSETAPRTGDTRAFSPTEAAFAMPNQNWPSDGPRRSTVQRPIAYDTTA